MSSEQWERAEIILPAAAAATVRGALLNFVDTVHQRAREESVALYRHLGKGTRSLTKFSDAYATYRENSLYGNVLAASDWAKRNDGTPLTDLVKNIASSVIADIVAEAEREDGRPLHQPTLPEVNRWAPKPTNRDRTFNLTGVDGFSEGQITFVDRTVIWDVRGGTFAMDYAYRAPITKAFFDALDNVHWTRESGGTAYASSPYRSDARPVEGGNYATWSYGPAKRKTTVRR